MNDLSELKQYVIAHARTHRIPRTIYQPVLDRIRTDDDGQPFSWAAEWSAAARAQETRGGLLRACRLYNFARFPFVDGPARQTAAEQGVRVFSRWAAEQPDVRHLDLDTDGGRVGCWTTGLSAHPPRPVLLVTGGIASTKEQWAAVLGLARRLGMAGIATEMPGIGENTMPYDRASSRLLTAILDAVCGRADVTNSFALALSFSGHLALRCALEDSRINGIVTAGAPVADFFTDTAWQGQIPRITRDTLAHLTRVEPEKLGDYLQDWAITGAELASLDVPVHYLASRRDEIIPPGEVRLLRTHLSGLRLLEIDDVHGSPGHATQARVWSVLSIQQVRGGRGLPTTALRGLLGLVRARQQLTGQ